MADRCRYNVAVETSPQFFNEPGVNSRKNARITFLPTIVST